MAVKVGVVSIFTDDKTVTVTFLIKETVGTDVIYFEVTKTFDIADYNASDLFGDINKELIDLANDNDIIKCTEVKDNDVDKYTFMNEDEVWELIGKVFNREKESVR